MAANPDTSVVEMDSVEGNKGGKVFLTLYFRNCSLMLAFIREHNTERSVFNVIELLYKTLGHDTFAALFPVILTDRGSEFTDPLSIEFDSNGKRRTRVFYCDPQRSNQKGGIEVTHEMIRRIIPKGKSFDNLLQKDVSLMMSHINSYKRKKLGNQSAYQLFSFIHGEGILDKLGISQIPSNEINLTPLLLKK
jgi:IS30 family transposase